RHLGDVVLEPAALAEVVLGRGDAGIVVLHARAAAHAALGAAATVGAATASATLSLGRIDRHDRNGCGHDAVGHKLDAPLHGKSPFGRLSFHWSELRFTVRSFRFCTLFWLTGRL